MLLKDKLLKTDLFFENEYFYSYIKIIEENKNTEKIKFKTQCHHVIPRIVYDTKKWTGRDCKDNLVNLLYKDHILAHYYLALCMKDVELKYKMICSINFILGRAKQNKLDVQQLQNFVIDLNEYQKLYEESKEFFALKIKGTTHETSEETKQKISKSNSGRIYINKDGIVRSLKDRDEVNLFLANGWVLGNPNNQNRDTKKGCTIVHKGDVEKHIKREELQEYLDNGWLFGITEAHRKATKVGTQKFYDSLTKEEKIKKCATYGMLGKKQPESQKLKISLTHKGKKQSEKQRLQNSINKKNTIYMTNGIDDVMIHPEREQEFIALGYYRGRSKNRKKYKKEQRGD